MDNINNKILESYNNIKKIQSVINDNLVTFLTKAAELVEMSEDMYQIEKSIKFNKISLKSYILDSECCIALKNNNIVDYTIDELKSYLENYENVENKDCSSYYLAISLYELLENIEKDVENKINLEIQLLLPFEGALGNIEGINVEEREALYNKVKVTLTNNYWRKGVITEENFGILIEMLNDIFNYYVNGYPTIPNDMHHMVYKNKKI